MGQGEVVRLYMCPRDLIAEDSPGACHVCGTQRIECCLGEADDPCRRPLMDAKGRVQTRAPRWWLQHTVTPLTDFLAED
ncbi:MAG: hypothetical protein GTO14_06970 [Anaerolineales bacterium]|nr:hypothetical protein [Anaerolineales bacterium]